MFLQMLETLWKRSQSKVLFRHFSNYSRDSLIKSIKLYESSENSKSVIKLSPEALLEFIATKLKIIYDAKNLLINERTDDKQDIIKDDWTDLDKHVALNLLRVTEVLEESLEKGEVNEIILYLEKLAKLWLNIFKFDQTKKMGHKNLLVSHTLHLFSKFELFL